MKPFSCKECSEDDCSCIPQSCFNSLRKGPEVIEKEMIDSFKSGCIVLEPPSGTKHDNGKPPIGLISSRWIKGVADVLDHGKVKYGAHNWRKGINISRLYDSMQRHSLDFNDRIDSDPDSQKLNILMVAVNAMMIYETLLDKPELDDRYKK